MANPEHLEILNQGVGAWNKWRREHPDVVPDLSEASLSGTNLIQAKLSRADLGGAELRAAQLGQADFTEAKLNDAELIWANFSGAKIDATIFADVDLSQCRGLEQADRFLRALVAAGCR